MTIQYCDVSGYAVVVVPGLNDSTVVTLHHWRHIIGAWEPTEHEILYTQSIKACPTIDEPDVPPSIDWISSYLAPFLREVSIRVPRKTTVSICLTQTAASLTRYDYNALDDFCHSYSDSMNRGVMFTRAHLPSPLGDVPAGNGDYVAVYTVKPVHQVRIYARSGSDPKLMHAGHMDEFLDITMPQEDPDSDNEDIEAWLADLETRDVPEVDPLDRRIATWVDTYLAPAFQLPADARRVQLFLPTEDLCANPRNTYNSVRERIAKGLQTHPLLEKVKVELLGTTDAEVLLLMLDRVFTDCKSQLVNRDKYLVSIEHTENRATVYVDHRIDNDVNVIYQKEIALTQTYDDSSELNTALKDALGTFRDSKNDMTPFMTLVVGLGAGVRSNFWFEPPVRLCMAAKWILGDRQVDSFITSHPEREKEVQVPQSRSAVVIDAGSGGTRAYVYRWRINVPAEVLVEDPVNGPFAHPRLPFVKLIGDCKVRIGIDTLEGAAVPAYLDPLFALLDQLLETHNIEKATTPLFALATGGMRSRLRNAGADLATYDALRDAINVYIVAKTVGVNSFQLATFGVALGDDEAMYGWITANYAMGRLDLAEGQATKGFLEMGGASLQVAYEAPADHAGRHMRFAINYRGFNRTFRVYTQEFDNLGARTARTRYISDRIRLLGNSFTVDRCWPRDNNLLDPHGAVVGTGLRHAVAAGAGVAVRQLIQSVRPVRALLPQDFLEAGHPNIPQAIEFVGGATYWYLSQGLYPANVAPAHRFNCHEMMALILDFARLRWTEHDRNVRAAAAAKVSRMTNELVQAEVAGDDSVAVKRTKLIVGEVLENTMHKRALLFNAMLGFATIFTGVKIGLHALFQPYDGVIGLNALDPAARVPYSWTLGRAVVHAIGKLSLQA